MKKFIAGCLYFLILFNFSSAFECNKDEVTVIYVNGIFAENEEQMKKETKRLQEFFSKYYPLQNGRIIFDYAFNPSHVGGFGDVAKSVYQSYFSTSIVNDSDLRHMAVEISSKVTTEKIVLVGHSQGSFYTNSLYHYLVKNGRNPSSIGVFNMATPSDNVAGSGLYLTSSTDTLINTVREFQVLGRSPLALPANTTLFVANADLEGQWAGHTLLGTYLPQASGYIAEGIFNTAQKLEVSKDPVSVCFPIEKPTLIQKVSYLFEDKTITMLDVVYVAANSPASDVVMPTNFVLFKSAVKALFSWFFGNSLPLASTQGGATALSFGTQNMTHEMTSVAVATPVVKKKSIVVKVSPKNPVPTAITPVIDSNSKQDESATIQTEPPQLSSNQNQPNSELSFATPVAPLKSFEYGSGMGGGGAPVPVVIPEPIPMPTLIITSDFCIHINPCVVKAGDVEVSLDTENTSEITTAEGTLISAGSSIMKIPISPGLHVFEFKAKNATGEVSASIAIHAYDEPLLITAVRTPSGDLEENTQFNVLVKNTTDYDLSDLSIDYGLLSDSIALITPSDESTPFEHLLEPTPQIFTDAGTNDTTLETSVSFNGKKAYVTGIPVTHNPIVPVVY
jgi:hypothetical protein